MKLSFTLPRVPYLLMKITYKVIINIRLLFRTIPIPINYSKYPKYVSLKYLSPINAIYCIPCSLLKLATYVRYMLFIEEEICPSAILLLR